MVSSKRAGGRVSARALGLAASANQQGRCHGDGRLETTEWLTSGGENLHWYYRDRGVKVASGGTGGGGVGVRASVFRRAVHGDSLRSL